MTGYQHIRENHSSLSEMPARSGHVRDESLWTVAQGLSEILSEGDREMQMLQGLLASKEQVVRKVWQKK